MTRLLVALAFFVSGASSLMLEVVWSKALGRVLGTTLEAITTVVAAYMFGLALGAAWAGRSKRLTARPVRAYGLLEAGIGAFALVSMPLVAALDGPLGAAYAAFGGEGVAYSAARFVAAFGLLLLPTTLMGATLPVLVSWGARRADLGRVLGTLYALNTAGAVAGTGIAGFVLLPSVGLSRTALMAGALSLTVGGLMVLASRAAESEAPLARAMPQHPTPASAERAAHPFAPEAGGTPGRPRLMLALFALSGAVSLSCQIAWSRLAATLLGSSVYSFTLVLATFLVGIALGSALLVLALGRRLPSWRHFAVLQWIAAAGVLYASSRIVDAPWNLLDALVSSGDRVRTLWLREGLLLAGVMLPACLAFGALFPVATRLTAYPSDSPARTAGRAYGWNTLGTVTGSLVTGFVLLQTVGTRWTLLGSAALALALGCAAWILAPARPGARSSIPEGVAIARWATPAAAIAIFVVSVGFMPSWDRGLFAMGVFRPILTAAASGPPDPVAARRALRASMAAEEMLWLREGRQATVTVHRLRADVTTLALRINGKTDASTGPDMATQILAAQLPMLWAPDSVRVLVIGYGSGVTAGSVLTHDPPRVELAEIEPAVLAADSFFQSVNGRPRSNPRLRIHVEDGRTFLGKRPARYGVIVSEPSNPWIVGVNNLFTEDFYRLVRSRLAEDGVFCQWTQFYELSAETLASMLRTLYAVFPNTEVFISGRDLLLVAPAAGERLDLTRVAARLARPKVAADLARAEVRTPADLVTHHRPSLADLVSHLPAAPLNTDDRPVVEYRAPRDLYRVRPSESPLPASALTPDDPVADLARWTSGADPGFLATEVAGALLGQGQLAQAGPWMSALARRDSAGSDGLAVRLADVQRRRDEAVLWAQAQGALEVQDLATARALLDRLIATAPRFAPARIERARMAMSEGDLERARTLFRQSLEGASPDEAYQAYCNLGMLDLRTGRPAAALVSFESATRARPEVAGAYVFRARALAQLGRGDDARHALDEGALAATDKPAIEAARDALRASAPAR